MLHIQIELFYLLPQIHSCLKERETLDNSIFNNSIFTPLSYQKRRCENIELIHANLGKPETIHNVDTTRYVATFGCNPVKAITRFKVQFRNASRRHSHR